MWKTKKKTTRFSRRKTIVRSVNNQILFLGAILLCQVSVFGTYAFAIDNLKVDKMEIQSKRRRLWQPWLNINDLRLLARKVEGNVTSRVMENTEDV